MIGIDWGTTNLRAFRINAEGVVVERRESADGILNVAGDQYYETLLRRVGDWLACGERQLLLSGMIGSRQGWVETEYLDCPLTVDRLAQSLMKLEVPGAEALLVPGLRASDAYGVPEVMRGEEVEITGILSTDPALTSVCLPGTHSKWVDIKDGQILGFQTFMTGDVFHALCSETILSKTKPTEAVELGNAFDHGVNRSKEGGGLLHHVFGVRTLNLTALLKSEDSASYLSGLLIGHEIKEALHLDTHVHLVGNPKLCALYARAIEICNGSSSTEAGDAAAKGHVHLARKLGWIG